MIFLRGGIYTYSRAVKYFVPNFIIMDTYVYLAQMKQYIIIYFTNSFQELKKKLSHIFKKIVKLLVNNASCFTKWQYMFNILRTQFCI